MERLPPTAFGRTLRTLIREHSGTQARLADAISVHSSWITKLVRGDQESLTYSSLQRLLEGFPSQTAKEQLYQAWLETYAPSPIEQGLPDLWSADEEIVAFAASVHDRISAGQILSTHQLLGHLWNQLKSRTDRLAVALAVGHAYVDTATQLDRPGIALRVILAMSEMAKSAQEPAWIAKSLWLRGVSLRLVRPRVPEQAERALSDLARYLRDWQPGSEEGRVVHWNLVPICARDLVLSGLDAVQGTLADRTFLKARIEVLRSSSEQLESKSEIALTNEVLARALIDAGRLDEAFGHAELAKKNAGTGAIRIKAAICKIQLLVADGQASAAEQRLERAMDFADRFCLVHHRHKLGSIQQAMHRVSSTSYSCPQ